MRSSSGERRAITLVENCRIWEVYDAALTNQNKTAAVRQENIVYRNNVIWNCEYSFEYWNHPETSVTRNIRFVNNTCVNAGVVWSHAQRPDPNGSHLMFYSNTAATSGFEVKYNIFYQVSDWGSRYTGGWKSLPEMDHNLWFSDQGVMANWFGKKIETLPGLSEDNRPGYAVRLRRSEIRRPRQRRLPPCPRQPGPQRTTRWRPDRCGVVVERFWRSPVVFEDPSRR